MKKRLLSLIPHKKVEVTTSLSNDEIVQLFSNSVSPQWESIWSPIWQTPSKVIRNLEGDINNKGFKLRVTSSYRKMSDTIFTTYLKGKFIQDENGVKVEMYLTGINYIIIPLLLCIIPFLLIGLLAIPNNESIVFSAALFALAFLLFIGEADQLDFHVSNILEKHIT